MDDNWLFLLFARTQGYTRAYAKFVNLEINRVWSRTSWPEPFVCAIRGPVAIKEQFEIIIIKQFCLSLSLFQIQPNSGTPVGTIFSLAGAAGEVLSLSSSSDWSSMFTLKSS